MLTILYEDDDLIIVEKPIGMDSQVSTGFAPDMVSEIKKYRSRLCPDGGEPYVGVIHRLDKPVGGVMVYAKTQKAAAALSKQVQNGDMQKKYHAVVCGKLVDNVGNYVDWLLKDGKTNRSKLVDQGTAGAKRAELSYRVLSSLEASPTHREGEAGWSGPLSLVEVVLVTGRHHQIRVQFAGHGTPLWGDNRYHTLFQGRGKGAGRSIALFAVELTLIHPVTGQRMTFGAKPRGEIFEKF